MSITVQFEAMKLVTLTIDYSVVPLVSEIVCSLCRDIKMLPDVKVL